MKVLYSLLLAVALSACGGGGDDKPDRPTFIETVASADISSSASYPIQHNYAAAGTYTLTLTGQYKVTSFSGPDRLAVWFSPSGQGTISAGAQPNYSVSANGQTINVSQEVTLTTTGSGPWLVQILCFTDRSTGTMSNLAFTSVLN